VHRYEELEKLYYKKMFLKATVVVVFIIGSAVGGFYYLNSQKNVKPKVKEVKTSKKEVKEANKTVKITQVKHKKTETKNEKPNQTLTFVLPPLNENDIKAAAVNKPKPIKSVQKPVKKTIPKPIQPKPVEKKAVVIEEKRVTLKDLINSYNTNPNYDLALMIAKKFYNKNDLKSAQIWAIKANNLDPSRVESWLLFADILLKEHKKQKALEILNIYLDQYGDNDTINAKIRSINE
jgi:tetratricopeptide (TPR) repeat protein